MAAPVDPRPARLYLIRHAKAGSRSAWTDDDALRPLSAKGRRQADGLAERLGTVGIARVLSSPAVRCRQTVVPLAERLGAPVEDVDDLGEGRPVAPALALLADLSTDTALCAHGDLIPTLLRHLTAAGMRLDGPPECKKASVWVLERDGPGFVVGRYTPPP